MPTDVETLELYRECHVKAQELGLLLTIEKGFIYLKKDNVPIYNKVNIAAISNFLAGYEANELSR